MSTRTIVTLWVVFAVLFFGLGGYETYRWKRGLKVDKVPLGFADLDRAYDMLRDGIIEADRWASLTHAVAFYLAGLTAVASLVVELVKA